MASNSFTKSIINTLCYAQIFAYPLTEGELWQYLLSSKKVSRKVFSKKLYQNRHSYEQIDNFFVLQGDQKLAHERIKRHAISVKKFKKAVIFSRLLFYIPTIKLIGISGSLSMYNAKRQDDIDLFFITQKNSLWTTRFLVNLVLYVLGQKRMRREKFAQDKICPNMFMSEDSLMLKKRDQNIYTAHEVVQMKVLFSKEGMHEKFLMHNAWVLDYMPHAFNFFRITKRSTNPSNFLSNMLLPIERILYGAQFLYMKKRITREKVGKSFAAFHKASYKETVLELYRLKILHQVTSHNKQKHANLASNYRHVN